MVLPDIIFKEQSAFVLGRVVMDNIFSACECLLFMKWNMSNKNRFCALSWYFSDSSHADGLTEGLDGVRRWVRLEIV
jgi:hypothetical protein